MFRNFLNFPNDLPQAGRLKHFLAAWEQITKDPWVLQVVSGFQIEFLANLVQRKHPSPYPMFIGPSNHNRSGGLGTVIKRGSPFRSTRLSTGNRIHQLPFCQSQKGWGPQASDKSKTPKLFHPIRTLQNGVHTHVKRSFKERGLHGENRPQRRTSDSPNMAELSKVPKVSVEGFTSGIRMPPLRFS